MQVLNNLALTPMIMMKGNATVGLIDAKEKPYPGNKSYRYRRYPKKRRKLNPIEKRFMNLATVEFRR